MMAAIESDPAPSYDAAEQADQPDSGYTYAAYYVDNLRTGAGHQTGYVSGDAAAGMLRMSPDPRRLRFVLVSTETGDQR